MHDEGLQDPNDGDIIKSEIEIGNIVLDIKHEKQARHIKGEPEYQEGRSYLTVSESAAQHIIHRKSGTGNVHVSTSGQIKEVIENETDFGINVDKSSREETPTNAGTIHYSKTGTHLVPTKRRNNQ